MYRFKVGAVLIDPSNSEILGRGCSHPDITHSKTSTSIHAERHALGNSKHLVLEGAWCVIFTFNGHGGCAWSSRPCLGCARALYRKGIERVVYPERKGKGWTVRAEHPEALIARAPEATGLFAREQRIPE